MDLLREFIEVTSQYDGKKACIRASLIEAITDNAEDRNGEGCRFACRTIHFAGKSINVIESYDDLVEMMYKAEL